MPSSNMHSVFKNVVHVVSTLWLIDHCSIWTSWSAGSDVDNDARTQRSQNLALNIYMQYISFYSPPSTSIIPVRTAFWCPELCWWCQPPTEFEITGKLCGFKLSICRICVHIFPNYINVDAVTICPTGFDASWSKLVPTRQNGFRRPTFVVVICGVNVGRGGNLTLCRLVHEVLGASVRELPLPLLPGLSHGFGLLNQSGALRQRHQHGGIEQFPVAEVVAKEVALASALWVFPSCWKNLQHSGVKVMIFWMVRLNTLVFGRPEHPKIR